MSIWTASMLIAALATCAPPVQYGGAIPIDHDGVAGRLRRACELGKATAAGGNCVAAESTDSEAQSSDELEEMDAGEDTESADAASTDRD